MTHKAALRAARCCRYTPATMKRSSIDALIDQAIAFFDTFQFKLPPFAFWTPQQWQGKGSEADEIRSRGLGWDVTTFGSSDFYRRGLLLFTLRNGKLGDPQNKKMYAEKIMVVREGQETPFHFHSQKTEDIINRGGGRLHCTLYNSAAMGEFAMSEVRVWCDGVERVIPAGGVIELSPGESITMTPGLYHRFCATPGTGMAMIGEVSSVNDDAVDNRFYESLPRYPAVEEDAQARHLLCTEYPAARKA